MAIAVSQAGGVCNIVVARFVQQGGCVEGVRGAVWKDGSWVCAVAWPGSCTLQIIVAHAV
eukprot:2979927-Prymnesium_polylepis.1